ncbi:MAG: OsmC family protein [Gammaproteobacteria bacterium]
MHPYPHLYKTSASATQHSPVTVSSPGLDELVTTPPPEFGGPEGHWSPETMLVASVANCFILTFRAIARASKVEWESLECEADGTLDRAERVTCFTRFDLRARLKLAPGMDPDKAERILHHAESVCLITASLKADVHLETEIDTA